MKNLMTMNNTTTQGSSAQPGEYRTTCTITGISHHKQPSTEWGKNLIAVAMSGDPASALHIPDSTSSPFAANFQHIFIATSRGEMTGLMN